MIKGAFETIVLSIGFGFLGLVIGSLSGTIQGAALGLCVGFFGGGFIGLWGMSEPNER